MGKTQLTNHWHQLPKFAIPVLFVLLILISGLYLTQVSGVQNKTVKLENLQTQLVNSVVLPATYKSVTPFSLINSSGEAITESIFERQWSLVFFGYMNCPDICPITLSIAKNAVDTLAQTSLKQPQIVFVTVDPLRDTAPLLKQYLAHFDDSFIGITGDVNSLSDWVTSMGVTFNRNNQLDKTNYSVDHSASIMMIDPNNQVRAIMNAPINANTITTDYDLIVTAYTDKL